MNCSEREANWNLFRPPARPSDQELEIYERLILGLNLRLDAKIVLFGCTPELRSLFGKIGHAVLCVDTSSTSFDALGKLRMFRGEEEFVLSNWMDFKISKDVDLILGDGSLNMLNKQRQIALVNNIYDGLHKDAHVLLRIHRCGESIFSSPKEVINHYHDKMCRYGYFSTIRTDLDMLWMNDRGEVDFTECNEKLNDLYLNGTLGFKEWYEFWRLKEFNRMTLHYTDHETYTFIESLFKAEQSFAVDYPRSDLHPIVLLKKERE